jgi:hypothetical protein
MIRVKLLKQFLHGSFWRIPCTFLNSEELKFLKEFFQVVIDDIDNMLILKKKQKFISRFN